MGVGYGRMGCRGLGGASVYWCDVVNGMSVLVFLMFVVSRSN